MTDLDYMRLAYQLACRGKGRTSPNPMVGAVLVKKGRIIGQGWHQRCGGPHAEILALRQAGAAASKDACLYVTLEPCAHHGRTPPCVDAILDHRVREVVIGVKDPNPLTNGKALKKLRRHGVKVRVGFLQEELEELNAAFTKYIRRGLPFVVIKSAQSLDGKIAAANGQSAWITSPAARAYARGVRNEFDAICVGIETVLKDNPSLSPARKSKRLKKIILDSRLRLPKNARLFEGTRPEDCLAAITARAETKRVEALKRCGVDVIVCPQKQGRPDLPWLFRELASRGISSVLVEGGAQVAGSVLRERLADRMHVYIAPKIFGDQQAKSAVAGFRIRQADAATQLAFRDSARIGPDLLLKADILYPQRRRPGVNTHTGYSSV